MGTGQQSLLTVSGVAATPDFDYTNLLWRVRAADLALSNDDPITTWFDLYSGSNRNWTQIGGDPVPLLKTNQINGHPTAYFDTKHLGGPDLSGLGLTEADVYILIKADSDPSVSLATSGLWVFNDKISANALATYPFTDGTIFQTAFIGDGNRLSDNPTPSLTSWRLYRVVAKTGTNNYEHFLDNVSLSSRTQATLQFVASTELGRSEAGAQAFLKGHVAEFFAFSQKCGSTQNGTIINYINSYYALSI
jgi:hypothetical protein